MFASMHSTSSSAGPRYGAGAGANVPSSKQNYSAGSTVPARFAVHMFQKPAYGPYYPPANNVKMDAVGYRPSMPQQQYVAPARYDDRYSPPHTHPAPPPRLNTAPSNLPRNYDPKPVPVSIPAPPPSRVAPNFNIYPGSAHHTFIYEQSQGSKSDLLSTSEFDSQASPTESISSTVTMRGADTPGTETSSLEPSPVEPSHSRRNSLIFNGGPSPTEASFRSPSTVPGARLSAFPPHMLAAMNKTPSESSLDNRERIAVVNAQYNSASTGSYYSSSPDPSSEPQPRASPPGAHTPMHPPSIPVESNSQRPMPPPPQQSTYVDGGYLQSSPESVHAHHVPQPTGGRSRSASPPQQAQQHLYQAPERPASRHETRRPQPTPTQSAPSYGPTTPMRRSPSQLASLPPTSAPTYAPVEDYFALPTATPTSRQQSLPQQHQYSPNSSYTNIKHNIPTPREDQYSSERQDRRHGSASPPSLSRQVSTGLSRDRSGSSYATSASTGAGHHQRYSPPDRSMDLSMRSEDDRYARDRDGVPQRRERRQSNAAYPPSSAIESGLSYSSSSGSGSGSDSTARGAEYSSRDRDRQRDRERERERDRERSRDNDRDGERERDRDRERERERDRDYYHSSSRRQPSRRASEHDEDAVLQQQQSTVPFVKSFPPSPPNQPLKYTPPVRAPTYPPPTSAAPEKMSSRTRSISMSTAPPPSAPLPPPPSARVAHPGDLSMSSLHISDPTPASAPLPVPPMVPAPPQGDAPAGYRRRRMSMVSQVSEAGSMATTMTTTTVATVGTIPNAAQQAIAPPPAQPAYIDHHTQRSPPEPVGQVEHVHPPAPFRRLSDGDRPVLAAGVRYDPKAAQHYPAHHQAPMPPQATIAQQQPYPPHPEPHRRYSDGESSAAAARGFRAQQREYGVTGQREQEYAQRGQGGARNVRWNEDLICPSPVLPPPKRKGWYNRRGDQLWTNDGMFRPAPPDAQYPPDLDDYPEHGEGWQNEDGVRIDMEHRRIAKVPRRSALKQTAFSAA